LERNDFAVNARFAHAPRDELRHLAAKIDDENGVWMCCLGHGEPLMKSAFPGNRANHANADFIVPIVLHSLSFSQCRTENRYTLFLELLQ
jgi:hypothetical protein